MTRYTLLKRIGALSEEEFAVVAEIEARSGVSAIRAYLDESPQNGESYVAVPTRSWRPVSVKVETKTALKFN